MTAVHKQRHALDVKISIPDISMEAQPKPHIVYHIALKLPVQSYTLKKRYSDFVELNKQLKSVTGQEPPELLPAKHYFSSTVKNSSLIEERRTGLETYLQAINHHINSIWRESPPWRTFLCLPQNRSAAAAAIGGEKGKKGSHGVAATWMDRYNMLKTDMQSARLQLARHTTTASSPSATSLNEQVQATSAARKVLMEASRVVDLLGSQLDQDDGKIGEGERRRRRDLLTNAMTDIRNLQDLSSQLMSSRQQRQGNDNTPLKKDLLSNASTSSNGRILGRPQETERTRELDNQGLLQLQSSMMKEQDAQLDQFSTILNRQKELGYQIGIELEHHAEILDRIETDVDRTGAKIKVAAKRADKLM